MAELFIFKAGKYPQGDWSIERVKRFVDAYDPVSNLEAPVVIGHRVITLRDSDQYAHGWITSLRMDEDGRVFATIEELSKEVRQAIAEKKLRYISAELYEFDKQSPAESPYLRAIALLGRDSPAIIGTRIPEKLFSFRSLFSGGIVSAADEKNSITTFTRKMNAEDIKTFSEETPQEDKEMADENAPATTSASSGEDRLIALEERLDKLEKQVALVATKIEALERGTEGGEKDETKAEEVATNSNRTGRAFFEKLRDTGCLTPAQCAKTIALDGKLGVKEQAEFRSLCSTLAPQIDLTGRHIADKRHHGGSAFDSSLTAKIRAYQKANKLSSFAAAADALYADKPDLFDEEEIDE